MEKYRGSNFSVDPLGSRGWQLCGGPQPIFDNLLTEDTNILKEYLAIVMDVRKYWKDETMEVQLRPDYRVLSLLYLYTI